MLRTFFRTLRTLRSDPSKLRKIASLEGLKKAPDFLRVQARKAAEDDQEKKRALAFQSKIWVHEDLSKRQYGSYDEYIAHQKSKLDMLLDRGTSITNPGRVEKFRKRFEVVTELLPNSKVLCLAARLGHEVEALISQGHFAVGIDLNPGPDNRFVVTGDFHHLQYADASVDCVYTNSLDHAWDLEKIVAEIMRVLKPGGIFIVEIYRGYEEGEVIGEYEALHWPTARSLADKIAALGPLQIENQRDLRDARAPLWPQFVMRKAA